MGNPLPAKEQSNFKQIVRHYELKQFKKALRSADLILKKFPDHGETLAMKGLVYNALEKKEEAYRLVRLGLRNDLRSHVCWHVYGLLYRSDREYVEASKAYLQALRIDKENLQILRDLALLQIQNRNYEGFNKTRRTILTLKPGQKNNWIAFALSHHLLRNYATAVKILDTYKSNAQETDEVESVYEKSEQEMYKNSILEESGKFDAALEHLNSVSDAVVDRLAVMEARVRILLGLKRGNDAQEAVLKLLDRNPDNSIYHKQYLAAVALQEDIPENDTTRRARRAIELCDQIRDKTKGRALLPKRMPLDILAEGNDTATKKNREEGWLPIHSDIISILL